MGIRLVRGRDFDETDGEQAPGVIIVSESMARRAWPGRDPLGKRIKMPMGESTPFHQQWLSVVGVVADVRYREIEAARLDVYMSYRQFASGLHHLVVRAEGDPLALAGPVRAAVRAIDPAQPVEDVRTMEEIVDAAVETRRLTTALFASLAAVALALAGLGVYGLMAYAVASRRREIGLRMALGAAGAHIMARVLVRGLALAATGAVAGLLIALALARRLRSMLYNVGTTDPTSFACATVALMLLAVAGCYLPARRASRVDPIAALREE
jgi:putative ABC transport system permease protein